MPLDPRTPIVIGAGQSIQRAASLAAAREPIELIADAVRAAAADAGLPGVPGRLGAVRVVNLLSWRYRNPALVLVRRLGVEAAELAYTHAGGHVPQMLVNRTALDVAAGRLDVAVLAGGEAWRTRMRAQRDGAFLDWAKAPADAPPAMIGDDLDMTHPAEADRGVDRPVQVYPLFETALRAAAGRSPADHQRLIAELWSRLSAVAAANPYAWTREALTADAIATVTEHNRVIGWPYTKAMNANNDVDMAAALIVCSVGWARARGVAPDRWVFPHAGSQSHEHRYVSHRWSLADTPAIRRGGEVALELAGVGTGDVALVDLYSCFPSAVQLGAQSLGLALEDQLTRTGGLSFAGGPWNNYAMHAVATMVGELRDRPGERGLVWANGGYATKHTFGVYAASPPAAGFRHASPQDEIDALPARALAPPADAAGPATVEAYTVMFDRRGPERAIATCLRADGRRAWATSDDHDVTTALTDGEWVGRRVTLTESAELRL